MSNERFENARLDKPQAIPPIWLMRQAGRYHRHYQKLRQKHSFMDLCKQPELAAQTALGPIEDFDFDVAILFSDLLFPLAALGMGLHYDPAPRLEWQLTDKTIGRYQPQAEALEALQFQGDAMRATRCLLPKDKSLIGFVGGPWTLFTYAVASRAVTHGALLKQFLQHMVPLLKANIGLQLAGGAEVVMVLDTAAGELAAEQFQHALAPALDELAAAYPQRLAYYSKGTVASHYDALKGPWGGFGFDHRWSLSERLANKRPGLLQGNFDQNLLFADDFNRVLQEWLLPLRALSPQQRRGWVCGLGHGILQHTPERHVRQFVDTIREVFQ
jgi:uroporphyrinogen decarboxylase